MIEEITENEIETKEEQKTQRPDMYQVVLLNDDFTPMDFVVAILMGIYDMNSQKAVKVMLDIHNEGRGICGVYTKEIAETKVQKTMRIAQKEEHPLLCHMEPISLDKEDSSGFPKL